MREELADSVSPRSVRIIKEQVYNAMFQTLSEAFETSEREMIESLKCGDFKEGVAHFLEKRAPVFTGKMNFEFSDKDQGPATNIASLHGRIRLSERAASCATKSSRETAGSPRE